MMLTLKPSAGACVRLSLSAAIFVGAGACAKTSPQSLPATGTVTVGVTSRGPAPHGDTGAGDASCHCREQC